MPWCARKPPSCVVKPGSYRAASAAKITRAGDEWYLFDGALTAYSLADHGLTARLGYGEGKGRLVASPAESHYLRNLPRIPHLSQYRCIYK